MLKTEVSAQNEGLKTLFLTTRWPKIFVFLPGIVFSRVNYPHKTDEFFSTNAVFSVVIPLRTLFIMQRIIIVRRVHVAALNYLDQSLLVKFTGVHRKFTGVYILLKNVVPWSPAPMKMRIFTTKSRNLSSDYFQN